MPTILVDESALDGDESPLGIVGSRPSLTTETAGGTLTYVPDGEVFGFVTFQLVGSPIGIYGTLTLNLDGTFSYTLERPVDDALSPSPGRDIVPNAEVFDYLVVILNGEFSFVADEGTIIVDVQDDVPVAGDDAVELAEGATITGTVLENDVFGADGPLDTAPSGGIVGVRAAAGDLTTAVTSGLGTTITGQFGTLLLLANGSYTYTASDDLPGGTFADNFVYSISDSEGDLDTATITFRTQANLVAQDDTLTAIEDIPALYATALLLANDDPGTVSSVFNAVNGAVSLDAATNTITFNPLAEFSGEAGFDYILENGGQTDVAHVTINVAPANDPPIALNDFFTGTEDEPLLLSFAQLLENDSDPDGDALTVVALSNPVNGNVSLDDDTILFLPAPDFNGEATFDYEISDGNGGTASATVFLTISSVNDPPMINLGFQIILIWQDERTFSVGLSDIDGDTPVLTVSGPENGTSIVNADNSITDDTNDGFTGIDLLTLVASDGLETDTASVDTVVTARPEISQPLTGLITIPEVQPLTFG